MQQQFWQVPIVVLSQLERVKGLCFVCHHDGVEEKQQQQAWVLAERSSHPLSGLFINITMNVIMTGLVTQHALQRAA